jgi:hypothetical protein
VIDLGPEGGDKGGRIVAVGTPEMVAQAKGSYTGAYLAEIFKRGRTARQPGEESDLFDDDDDKPAAAKKQRVRRAAAKSATGRTKKSVNKSKASPTPARAKKAGKTGRKTAR